MMLKEIPVVYLTIIVITAGLVAGIYIGLNSTKLQKNLTVTTTTIVTTVTFIGNEGIQESIQSVSRIYEIAKELNITNLTKIIEVVNIVNTTKISGTSKNIIEEQLLVEEWIPIIVRVKDYDLIDSVINDLGRNEFILKRKSEFNFSPTFSGDVTKNAILKLINNLYVEDINYDLPSKPALQDSIALVNADKVWQTQTNGLNITGNLNDRNITICVIDTGINYSHPDLGGCPRTNNINTANCNKVIGGHDYDALFGDDDPMDENGHGTHVAGIVVANGSIKGMAPDAKLVALRATGLGNIQSAIDWCINNRFTYNISIISISQVITYLNGSEVIFSSNCDNEDDMIRAANSARQYNIFVASSSGNSGSKVGITEPACGSNVTSVGATYDKNNMSVTWTTPDPDCTDSNTYIDQIACGSNRASILDLLAPGGRINSTYIWPQNYTELHGTSMAAPHVSGLVALMKQANNSLTPSEIESIMKRTGKPIYDSATKLTVPRIDAYRAVIATLYDVFVSDLNESYSDAIGNKIFSFSIFNDLNATINVSWSLNVGNGTNMSNIQNISLPAYNETFVYVEYFYDKSGEFNVTTSIIPSQGSAANQAIAIFVSKPNIKVTNLSILNSTGTKRIAEFWVENNSTITQNSIYWQLNRTNEVSINSTQAISLGNSSRTFVYVEFSYATGGSHNITAIVDYNNTITEINETDNSITIVD